MSDWQLYAAIYLGIGFAVSMVAVVAHLFGTRNKSKFVRDMMKAVNPRREAFFHRVLEDLVVPALAFFLMWLVWPVVFVLKIKDSLHCVELTLVLKRTLNGSTRVKARGRYRNLGDPRRSCLA